MMTPPGPPKGDTIKDAMAIPTLIMRCCFR